MENVDSVAWYVLIFYGDLFADVAELADALDLGSSVVRRGGSIPLVRTIFIC